MSENLKIYNAVRSVPKEAQKQIGGGRLKGMTDINPMWRIKVLTEQFGICGIGWKYEIVDQWYEKTEPVNGGELTAHVKINLYVKVDGQWSDAIPGLGGSMLTVKEKNGLYVDDECYKKALTDAISVACKALGVGADIYWDKDRTKYSERPQQTNVSQNVSRKSNELTYREKVIAKAGEMGITMKVLAEMYSLNSTTTEERFKEVLAEMEGK